VAARETGTVSIWLGCDGIISCCVDTLLDEYIDYAYWRAKRPETVCIRPYVGRSIQHLIQIPAFFVLLAVVHLHLRLRPRRYRYWLQWRLGRRRAFQGRYCRP
jgi:hypothetical protein